jgi:hypothetical protein
MRCVPLLLSSSSSRRKPSLLCPRVHADFCEQINTLFQRISYVERNEETSCIKLVHFYGNARTTSTNEVAAPKAKEETETVAIEGGSGNATPATDSSGVEHIPPELESNFRRAFSSLSFPLLVDVLTFPRPPSARRSLPAHHHRPHFPTSALLTSLRPCPRPTLGTSSRPVLHGQSRTVVERGAGMGSEGVGGCANHLRVSVLDGGDDAMHSFASHLNLPLDWSASMRY